MSRNRNRIPIATAVLALLAALAFGACGGSKGGGSSTAGGKTGSPASVDIKDFAFKPDKITVKAGTKVTWTNDDGFDHTVSATDKSFDSDHIAPKASFSRTFDQAGTFAYMCNIHNSMTGTVIVTP